MIITLDNLALYTRLLLLVSPGQLVACHVSCSLGKNVGAVIHSIHLFEHFPSSDQLSVAGVDKV